MMERAAGAAISDIRAYAGRRQSVFGSYVAPVLHQPNLDVLTTALVTRVSFDADGATGVELLLDGQTHRITATTEVILSLGAIHTPKVLLHSGIGDESELRRVGISLRNHLPGVGRNLQDHPGFDCVWEYREPLARATTPPRPPTSRRVHPGWRSPICRPARPKCPSPALRTSPGLGSRNSAGPCSPGGPTQEPRPSGTSVGQSTGRHRHPRQHARPPRRRQGCHRGSESVPRNRKLRTVAAIRQTRSHAGQPHGNALAPCVVIGERTANIIGREYGL